jgi:pyruvate/2-oxoglutarate dehydrogenase complex dihydrolipoamide dehydrogenase (E3) component
MAVEMSNLRQSVSERSCDFAILGAGPAGLAAAKAASRLGLQVTVVEQNKLGGNSLNIGTVPFKTLIRTAQVYETTREAEEFGLSHPVSPEVSFSAVLGRMRHIRARVAEYHSPDRLRALGVDLIYGAARFVGPNALAVGDGRLLFKKALIATGARARRATIPGLDAIGYLTSESVFEMGELPKRLAIVGGGPAGCELAQAFCRLGAHVTIIQGQPKFLPLEERDAAELLSRSMARDGVDIRLNTRVVGARMQNEGKILDAVSDAIESMITADEIILSIGRVPNVEGMGLDRASIAFTLGEGIAVDDCLRTTNVNVYAAGDVCVAHKFANVAETSACLAVENAFTGKMMRHSELAVPWCTYCDPEIAHIGMQVLEARKRSIPIKTYTVMMQDVDRAITDGQDEGFVKLHVREGTDRILGATIVSSRASEMINEVSVAMSAGMGLRGLARVLHTYPAQSEAIRMAAMAYVGSLSAV